jgi:hypothetical protein
LRTQVFLIISICVFSIFSQAESGRVERLCVAKGGQDSNWQISASLVIDWSKNISTLAFTRVPWQAAYSYDFVYSDGNMSLGISPDQSEMAIVNWKDGQNAEVKVGDRIGPMHELGKHIIYYLHCNP